MSVNIQDEKL